VQATTPPALWPSIKIDSWARARCRELHRQIDIAQILADLANEKAPTIRLASPAQIRCVDSKGLRHELDVPPRHTVRVVN
jgi:hypothetical protein